MPIVGSILSCLLRRKDMNYTLRSKVSPMPKFNDYRDWVIGYDKIFQTMLDLPSGATTNQPNYPPHNLIEDEQGKFTIKVAVAGLDKDDITITLEEQNLSISYEGHKISEKPASILYQGISQRNFNKMFHIADSIEVVDASIDKGMLVIKLEQQIPEHKKPKTIVLK